LKLGVGRKWRLWERTGKGTESEFNKRRGWGAGDLFSTIAIMNRAKGGGRSKERQRLLILKNLYWVLGESSCPTHRPGQGSWWKHSGDHKNFIGGGGGRGGGVTVSKGTTKTRARRNPGEDSRAKLLLLDTQEEVWGGGERKGWEISQNNVD